MRCGLAYAWDEPTVNATISQNVFPIANGPFAPETPGHLDDTGYPQQQDMDRAKELIAEYKAENPGPLNLSLATTQDETNLTVAQFQKQWWEEAGVDSSRSTRSIRATTSSPPSSGTSRCSSGATTAVSTSTTSTSGGTRLRGARR